MSRTAELHSVFEWACDECGRDNIAREVPAESVLTAADIEEMREECGIQPWQQGEWHSVPTSGKCRHCGTAHDFTMPGDPDDSRDDCGNDDDTDVMDTDGDGDGC